MAIKEQHFKGLALAERSLVMVDMMSGRGDLKGFYYCRGEDEIATEVDVVAARRRAVEMQNSLMEARITITILDAIEVPENRRNAPLVFDGQGGVVKKVVDGEGEYEWQPLQEMDIREIKLQLEVEDKERKEKELQAAARQKKEERVLRVRTQRKRERKNKTKNKRV